MLFYGQQLTSKVSMQLVPTQQTQKDLSGLSRCRAAHACPILRGMHVSLMFGSLLLEFIGGINIVQIKQMVEVLINRAELMPMDETIDQHQERKTSENTIVETDRTSELGLFKGCFNKQPLRHLQFNEEDRIYRCSRCAHEYVRFSGPMCINCGTDFEGDEEEIDADDFSDVDAEFGYHVDLDAESDDDDDDGDDDDDDAELEDIDSGAEGPYFLGEQASPLVTHLGHANVLAWGSARIIRGPRGASISSNSENSEDEEETESMHDFIEDDENGYGEPGSYHSPGSASHVSLSSRGPESVIDDNDNGDADESSDEGGAVSTGRRRAQAVWAAARGTPSVVTLSDSTSTSEAGDLAEESRRLHESGWSPLEQEPDSDYGEHQPFVAHGGSVDSDTDTTVGNQASDEEDDDRHRENGSATPVWATSQAAEPHFYHGGRAQSIQSHSTEDQSDVDGYDSDVHETNFTDREGDVEMSVSPVSSRRNSIASGTRDRRARRSVEILGSANTICEIEDDSSDGTVQPANRRRRAPRYFRHSYTPGYDPRISMMFAQHQLDLRDVTARQSPYFEPAPRSRTTTSYRLLPARGSGSSNHPYTPPAVILTSVSNRPNRVQRQYPRRYFN